MNPPSFEYESKLLVESFQESFLLIASKGLCVERLFYKQLQLYSDPAVLVLVLNATKADETFFSKCLTRNGHAEPKILNSETAVNERRSIYLEGGVQFVTTRILISDFLCDRIPLHLVSGILVYRAHRVLRSALESFVLLMFRKKKKQDGFVKAFSDSPSSFVNSFGQLQRAVSCLRVRKVHFLPRYHVDIIKELDQFRPNLEELAVKLSPNMKTVLNFLVDLVHACLQELKRCRLNLPNELSFEYALLPWFEETCHRQIEESVDWAVSPKVKRLLSDISRLRHLLNSLETDCGKTFFNALETIRNSPHEHTTNSGWLFTSTAEKLFETAKKRQTEVPGKWYALKEVLAKLCDRYNNEKGGESIRIIIAANEESVCVRLKELLLNDESTEINERMRKEFGGKWVPDEARVEIGFDEDKISWAKAHHFSIFIISLLDRYALLEALVYYRPTDFILFSSDIWLLRQLETYSATRYCDSIGHTETVSDNKNSGDDDDKFRIHFLMYENSVEEQRYLTSLKQERTSFEQLFKEETTLLLRKDMGDQLLSEATFLNQDADDSIENQQQQQQPSVIVDLREFRSELPALLHTRDLKLHPATLTVGDYVLSPDICVERKASVDLVSSLQSGRLFAQCRAMTDFYQKPALLVEMRPGKRGWRRGDDRQSGVKLAVLAMNFPRLSFIWASSPSSAAELLIHFKFKRDEPDLEKAVAVGKDRADLIGVATSSTACHRMLNCLPGVSSKNVDCVAKMCKNMRQFCCQLDERKLGENVSSSTLAKSIASFVNKDFRTSSVPALKKTTIKTCRKRK